MGLCTDGSNVRLRSALINDGLGRLGGVDEGGGSIGGRDDGGDGCGSSVGMCKVVQSISCCTMIRTKVCRICRGRGLGSTIG